MLTVFSFSAFSLQWSRASLIEYCAVFFGISFALFLHKLWENSSAISFLIAAISGGLCAAIKSTTLLTFLVFGFLLLPSIFPTILRYREHGKKLLLVSSSCLTPIVVAYVWTRHADHIKAANPATRWLQSAELNE